MASLASLDQITNSAKGKRLAGKVSDKEVFI